MSFFFLTSIKTLRCVFVFIFIFSLSFGVWDSAEIINTKKKKKKKKKQLKKKTKKKTKKTRKIIGSLRLNA